MTQNHTPAISDEAAPDQEAAAKHNAAVNINRLLEVELDVIVRFGITTLPLSEVARLGVGAMIELGRGIDEPVELLINNRVFARGEVVVVDGYYGVRIIEIAAERLDSLPH